MMVDVGTEKAPLTVKKENLYKMYLNLMIYPQRRL